MEPSPYRIVLRGHLSQRWAGWFGLGLQAEGGMTTLHGQITDQAHLYGVLDQIRNLGLELVSVQPEGASEDGSRGRSPEERPVR
jgi:hypothetical protein